MTAAVDRCERTELPPEMCSHCRGHDERPVPKPALGPWFEAAYAGRCCRCGRPFNFLDIVRADWPDGSGYISHECCSHARVRKARR